jgi:hypothetical protein
VELADEAGVGAGGLARVVQRALGALERGSAWSGRVERLDDALGPCEAALGDARDVDALVGQVVAREEHARHLEERDPLRAGVDVATARPRRGSAGARVRSAVSSTEIGSGSFHGVSSSARSVGV